MGKLQDKVVIITGGVSGIGAESAKLFAAEGAKLVLVDMDQAKGVTFESELKSQDAEVVFVQADVTDEAEVKSIFDTTISTFGNLDVLFNNAGIGSVKPTEELSYSEWRRTVEVDLDAMFLFAQAGIKEFLKQDGGVIVNTASMYGWVGSPDSAAYNATKGGVINSTRSLGLEHTDRNMIVNSLCPGFIETPILGETDRDFLSNATPMKRLGQAEEIAKAGLFLASDDSSFMTGNSLIVDGGYTAQ